MEGKKWKKDPVLTLRASVPLILLELNYAYLTLQCTCWLVVLCNSIGWGWRRVAAETETSFWKFIGWQYGYSSYVLSKPPQKSDHVGRHPSSIHWKMCRLHTNSWQAPVRRDRACYLVISVLLLLATPSLAIACGLKRASYFVLQ